MNDDTKFTKAHQAIGEYFSEFSELERELGEAVKVVLHLEDHPAADLVVGLLRYPGTKARLVKDAAQIATKKKDGSEISTKWKTRADKTLGKILNHNDTCRDHLAHSHLEPQEDGTVKVTRRIEGQWKSKNWDLKTKINEVQRLTERLRKVRDELSELEVEVGKIHWVKALFRDDPRRYLGPQYDQTHASGSWLERPLAAVAGTTKSATSAAAK